MAQLFANAARAPLHVAAAAGDTVIEVAQDGFKFPAVTGGDWFRGVLQDAQGIEVVRVTGHEAGSNFFSIERAQEGTVARQFVAMSTFALRMTAEDLQNFLGLAATSVQLSGNQTVAGDKSFTGSTSVNGLSNTDAFYRNARIVSGSRTIGATENVMSVGPLEIADGSVIEIADGGEWSIV